MSSMLAPLSDFGSIALPHLTRSETHSLQEMTLNVVELTRAVYPHEQVYGDFCTVQDYVDCPPDELYAWLSDTRSLEEWTYSLRGFEETDEPGLWISDDLIEKETKIYTRTVANPVARTVDYHCAWDQSDHLWMIYLMRVVDAQLVLNKPGSVVLWTNCHHPFYEDNPYQALVPEGRATWVGDYWPIFGAGHTVELRNLKTIAEYRHSHGLPVVPAWMK